MPSSKTPKSPARKTSQSHPEVSSQRPAAPGHTLPAKILDTFPNPNPERDFLIHMQIPEFTCNCPLTGQPDFANITIDTIPDTSCVELKALKLYMWSYRNEGAFHEAVTNRILEDLVKAIKPRYLRVTAKWYVRHEWICCNLIRKCRCVDAMLNGLPNGLPNALLKCAH
jgi:7-cyano-7-deazaguanine reductase